MIEEFVIGFIIGSFLMLPIFRNNTNFYRFILQLARERKTKVKEVKL